MIVQTHLGPDIIAIDNSDSDAGNVPLVQELLDIYTEALVKRVGAAQYGFLCRVRCCCNMRQTERKAGDKAGAATNVPSHGQFVFTVALGIVVLRLLPVARVYP